MIAEAASKLRGLKMTDAEFRAKQRAREKAYLHSERGKAARRARERRKAHREVLERRIAEAEADYRRYGDIPDGYKLCSRRERCVHSMGPLLPIAEFHVRKKSADGRNGVCKACVNAGTRDYQKRNPQVGRLIKMRRKTRGRNLLATLTPEEWRYCLEYWNSRCAYCGRPQGLWHTLAQDHFIPLTRGGAYTKDNILPACHGDGGCNNSKHNSPPDKWIIEHFGKLRGRRILSRIHKYFSDTQTATFESSARFTQTA